MKSISAIVIPTTVVFGLFGFAAWLVFFGIECIPVNARGVVGTLIAGVLGAAVSTFVWYLTHWQKQRESNQSKYAFRLALWNDITALQDVAYREAAWWQVQVKDRRIGATSSRLIKHIQTGMLESNLTRLTELPVIVADRLLALRAGLLILKDVHEAFYPNEDKILRHWSEKKLTDVDAAKHLWEGKTRLFQTLVKVAGLARAAAVVLDPDGAFYEARKKTFTDEKWQKREEFEAKMNAELDAFREQYLDD